MLKQWMHAIRWSKVIWKIYQITFQMYTFLDLFISNTLRSILWKSFTFWHTDYLRTLLYVNNKKFRKLICKKSRLGKQKQTFVVERRESWERIFVIKHDHSFFLFTAICLFYFIDLKRKQLPQKSYIYYSLKTDILKKISTKHSTHLQAIWSKSVFRVLNTRTSSKSHRNVILQAGRDVLLNVFLNILLQFILHKMLRRILH